MANLFKSSDNILLSNLINIRWIAIIGQFFAILFVYYFLLISIPLTTCLLIVLISIIVNFISLYTNKKNIYLKDKEAFYFLLYDTIQLGILLYLTGGIYNPFSLLLIAPIVISASYLRLGYSIILSIFSISIVIMISFFYIEIDWSDNFVVPSLFTYGLILSLVISLIFIAIYVYILSNSSRKISSALNQTQLALINQKKMSEVGSLAAAAVHELSTPLNTILLILNDLKKNDVLSKNKDIKSEISVLESQADRCKKILFNLSKNPQKIKDTFLEKVKLSDLIKINFHKFKRNDILLHIKIKNENDEPKIKFYDEIMYGLGNIIQNTVEYAVTRINVAIYWNNSIISLIIKDDGKGFPKEVLDKIGSPFISYNKFEKSMGLGIFIAKNLIENVGGKIEFRNQTNTNGSCVEIHLNRNI